MARGFIFTLALLAVGEARLLTLTFKRRRHGRVMRLIGQRRKATDRKR
jgi:hypothetical protein